MNTLLSLLALLLFLSPATRTSSSIAAKKDAPTQTSESVAYGGVTRQVDEAVKKFIKKAQKANGGEVSESMFSRCPSGYRQQYVGTPNPDPAYSSSIARTADGRTHGVLYYNDGCASEAVCRFRIHDQTLSLEAKDMPEANMPGTQDTHAEPEYVSGDRWIEAHFANKATM